MDPIYKNLLQELCQKQKIDLPVYQTKRYGDSEILWRSAVKITSGAHVRTFSGLICTNKKDAEQSAAECALRLFFDAFPMLKKESKTEISIRNTRIAILIDYENLPGMVKSVSDIVGPDRGNQIQIYAFVGEHHHSVQNVLPDNVIKKVVKSSRTDAVDSCIQTYVGWLLAKESLDEYVIVTRDHFGFALVDMITGHGYPWAAAKAAVITNKEMMVEYLKA